MRYTLAQFRGYVRLAQRRERAQFRQLAIATAAGMSGGEPLTKLLKALED